MNRDDYEILVNSMPAARDGKGPPEFAVKLLEDTCKGAGLDWKRRHVYLMQRGGKWGVTLSIDGFRLIGAQHPDYAGQEGPFWVGGPDQPWTDIPPEGRIYAAKVGIKHRNGTTTWGVAKFADYKAGPMWDKFPSTMSAKCAEMLAWRKAFPGSLGGLYGLEEMAQADKGAAKVVEGLSARGEDDAVALGGNGDALKNSYLLRLQAATDSEALRRVGTEISADKRLEMNSVLELHKIYTGLRVKMGG
jgi:RecT family protein